MGGCQFCHIHKDRLEANLQRPGKQIRVRLKRTMHNLLQARETSPDRAHEELQRWARGSCFARNLLAGYLDREGQEHVEQQGLNRIHVQDQTLPSRVSDAELFSFLKGVPLSL
ncbi:rnf12-b [Symbiodinium natans]|uniref:Rnf12-b protein n=1 Tax=Symbiodinium natans TaxID=878477 RepID=A0A812S629_9DINO|nr:rnf12-b [Symbiodinium natans]